MALSMACLAGACLHHPTAAPPPLCDERAESPRWSKRVPLPGTSTSVLLPASYVPGDSVWRVNGHGELRVIRRPRDSTDVVPLPRCRVTLTGRTVGLEKHAEFGEARFRFVVTATWAETPGTELQLLGMASSPKASAEQIAVIHSLRREPPTDDPEAGTLSLGSPSGPVPGMWMDSVAGRIEVSFPIAPVVDEIGCGYFDDTGRRLFWWMASGSYPDAWTLGNHLLNFGLNFYLPDTVPITVERLDSAIAEARVEAVETSGEPPMWGTTYPVEAQLARENDRLRLVVRARPLVEAFLRTGRDSVRLSWCDGQRYPSERRVPLSRH
jgi:hypothetical protein